MVTEALSIQPTYEELKPEAGPDNASQKASIQPTYEELKHAVNGNDENDGERYPAYL